MFTVEQKALAEKLLDKARRQKKRIATAESCTGGLIAALITDIAGSSDVFDSGYVTYANDAKMRLLGVPHDMLSKFGAVSYQVAEAMANGALADSEADMAVSVTGIAGPGGGTEAKPVGLVFIALAVLNEKTVVKELRLSGDRQQIRAQAVEQALQMMVTQLI